MIPYIIDIETGPRPDAEHWLAELSPPKSYKKQESIDDWLREKRQEQMEEAALSAITGRVLAVGLKRGPMTPRIIHHDTEAELLKETWSALSTGKGANDVFVTFNGTSFDWPFLARRSLILGVPVPNWFPWDGKWNRTTHRDLMHCWQCSYGGERISLDKLSRLCGLPGKLGSGGEFAELWKSEPDKARDYLIRDLELTHSIYKRIYPED